MGGTEERWKSGPRADSFICSPLQVAVPAVPQAVPSVPGAASAKGARTSAAVVPETHPFVLGEILEVSVQCMSPEVEMIVP